MSKKKINSPLQVWRNNYNYVSEQIRQARAQIKGHGASISFLSSAESGINDPRDRVRREARAAAGWQRDRETLKRQARMLMVERPIAQEKARLLYLVNHGHA